MQKNNKFSTGQNPDRSGRPFLTAVALGFTLAIIFIIGLALGFLGRPLLIQDLPVAVAVTIVPNADLQSEGQGNQSPLPSVTSERPAASIEPEADSLTTAPTPTIMEFVLADARHSLGNTDVPVVMVEFSDFK